MYNSENNQSPKGKVKVILLDSTPIAINGDITGRMYVFRKVNDSNWVDARDVLSMKENKGLQIIY